MVVQGQIEINLRGLCKGRGIIQRAELQGVTSWPINVGLITPRAVMDTSGACARLSSPPASSPAPPLRSMYLELNEETEKESRHGDEKNTGVTTINRFERRIDRKFSVPKHPVFRSTFALPILAGVRIWSEYTNFFRSSCERANGGRKLEQVHIHIYIYLQKHRNILLPSRIVMRSSSRK